MILSFFEYKTKQIDSLKDKPYFTKEYGADFMRSYCEEMQYSMYCSFLDDSLDINTELDRIEEKYRFNEDMNILLDSTAQHLRRAILIEYVNWKRNAEESIEAEIQVKEFCKLMKEEMNRGVELHPEPICEIDTETREAYNLLKEVLKETL